MSSSDPHMLAQLLSRTALRDEAAYEALYRAAAAKLFGFALRILGRRDLAEDCLQDAFVSVWHRAADYRPDLAQPMTWMTAIVRNRALDLLRAAPRVAELPDERIMAEAATDTGPAELAAYGDDRRALMRCLEALPARHRQAIALSYFRGLTHAELAAALAEPLGTVKTWIRKGLMQLKRCLEQS